MTRSSIPTSESTSELKELNVRLQKMNEETPAMREKQKADALMENEMYVHAIQVYQNLLEREDLEEIREGMTEKVYQILAVLTVICFRWKKLQSIYEKHTREAGAGRHWKLI